MGDAGEGLIDADARIQERMDELEQARKKAKQGVLHGDPEKTRQLESCRLARTELQRQLDTTTHQARKQQLKQALVELDKRIKALS
jgi:ABC-type phosphate transport system auxiliary subunit